MADTTPTPPARMIPARALTLPELEEIVRRLVDIANDQRRSSEDLALIFADADDATAGA